MARKQLDYPLIDSEIEGAVQVVLGRARETGGNRGQRQRQGQLNASNEWLDLGWRLAD